MSTFNSFRSILETYAKGANLDDKPEFINLFTAVSGVSCVTDTRGRTVYRALPAEQPTGYRSILDPTPVLDKTVPGGFITKQEAIRRTYDAIGAVADKIEIARMTRGYFPPLPERSQPLMNATPIFVSDRYGTEIRVEKVVRDERFGGELIVSGMIDHELPFLQAPRPGFACNDPNCICRQPIMIDVQRSFGEEEPVKPILKNTSKENFNDKINVKNPSPKEIVSGLGLLEMTILTDDSI